MVFRVLLLPEISEKIAFYLPTGRGFACIDKGAITPLPYPGTTPGEFSVLGKRNFL